VGDISGNYKSETVAAGSTTATTPWKSFSRSSASSTASAS